jgi:hypothetical protein
LNSIHFIDNSVKSLLLVLLPRAVTRRREEHLMISILFPTTWLALVMPVLLVAGISSLGIIDVTTEQVLTFSQLAKRLPRRRRDRPTSASTIHRWRCPGVRGVRLEAIRLGGAWCTSLEAFQRFCEALTNRATPNTPQAGIRCNDAQIEQQLDDFGI